MMALFITTRSVSTDRKHYVPISTSFFLQTTFSPTKRCWTVALGVGHVVLLTYRVYKPTLRPTLLVISRTLLIFRLSLERKKSHLFSFSRILKLFPKFCQRKSSANGIFHMLINEWSSLPADVRLSLYRSPLCVSTIPNVQTFLSWIVAAYMRGTRLMLKDLSESK